MVKTKTEGLSRSLLAVLAIGIMLGSVVTGSAVYFLLQSGAPAQQMAPTPKPVQQLQKFKADGWFENNELGFLVMDGGKDRGIWGSYGLDPEFITLGRSTLAADIKNHVSSGVKIGLAVPSEVLLARSTGLPVMIVAAHYGESAVKVYVKSDSSIRTVKDLDGKKIGVESATGAQVRHVAWLNKKFEIKAESVPIGNITNEVVALKVGRIDAFMSATGAPLRLVDSGELRIPLRMADVLPKPWAGLVIYATEDLIAQNPDLVSRFVKATLETVRYLKDNPRYAADLYTRKTNAPRDLAEKVISPLDWTPDGLGGGLGLTTGVRNNWQWVIDSGAVSPENNVKVEDAVDVRFLP